MAGWGSGRGGKGRRFGVEQKKEEGAVVVDVPRGILPVRATAATPLAAHVVVGGTAVQLSGRRGAEETGRTRGRGGRSATD